ncbi:hypothetical protein FB45DRAFT_788926 [Roridomyces roridus]|uniref:Transaldolase n=1 Tax=Roridomyces roridus TaxID=1738132 RepID=A0AAD7FQ11_9AGAR|nr:hypothetical protein FB45DRAFT_788926 [Roridomyces roridus]
MSNLLEVLETQMNVDVDSMDPKVAKSFPIVPHNMTSNQLLVNEQMQVPENREMFLTAVKEYGDKGWEAVLDRISVLICAANIDNIQGRVLLQTSPFHAYDTQKVVDHARRYAVEFAKVGIDKSRFCIKIPATGPAMNAGPILLKEGIRTLGTSLFSLEQAIASSQAGCLYISPYYNEVRAHADHSIWPESEDPATKHTMSSRLIQIMETYKRLYKETGKPQPMIKSASFISWQEAMACGEMEMHHATISAEVLAQLAALPATSSPSARIPGVPKVDMTKPYENARPTPERLANVSKTDPIKPEWDGVRASTDIDYLADNGKALQDAIERDPATKQRLYEALELFKGGELRSKALIEAAIADLKKA